MAKTAPKEIIIVENIQNLKLLKSAQINVIKENGLKWNIWLDSM